MGSKQPATSDSDDYHHTFWGILNRQGDFWTPLPFNSEDDAKRYMLDFIQRSPGQFDRMPQTHKIVPVRVQLTQIANAEPTP